MSQLLQALRVAAVELGPDHIRVNAINADQIETPLFLQFVKERAAGRGVFILVRTSNPGAGQFQDLICDGRPLYRHVAAAVGAWAREHCSAGS